MKVALIHYWLVGMRSGEKVLETLCRMFPDADIYTHVYDSDSVSATLRSHRVFTTFIDKLPMARKFYRHYLPLMPIALEELDLGGYDLVISSEAGPAKGVIVPPDTPHVCYCHSPMRYLRDQYPVYKKETESLTRLGMAPVIQRLRQWDVQSAARVDRFVASSTHVANRIRKCWGRNADVVHPPVAVEEFHPVPPEVLGDFYLWVGELVSYKRPDLAIDAFNELGLPLVVIGGPDRARRKLQKRARSNICFLGHVGFDVLRYHMARCKALVFPGEEDFPIVPVEVMASGRPVVAYGRGGVVDTIRHDVTGLLFDDQTAASLSDAVDRFEGSELANGRIPIRTHAKAFSEKCFRENLTSVLKQAGFWR